MSDPDLLRNSFLSFYMPWSGKANSKLRSLKESRCLIVDLDSYRSVPAEYGVTNDLVITNCSEHGLKNKPCDDELFRARLEEQTL